MYLRTAPTANTYARGSLQCSPKPPSWSGRRLTAPPQEPLRRSRPLASNFGSSDLRSPPPKKDMGSVSNQNRCKGFRFTEKVEKHWSTDCQVLMDLICSLLVEFIRLFDLVIISWMFWSWLIGAEPLPWTHSRYWKWVTTPTSAPP